MGTIIHANMFLLAPRTEVDRDSSVLRLATTALAVALFSLGYGSRSLLARFHESCNCGDDYFVLN
jgi:hypothetical protein